MAVLQDLITRVRRRLHDDDLTSEGRPLYPTITYVDAVNRALARVNFDLDQAWTIGSVPANREFIVELRTTIEMCKVRGAEAGSSDVSDAPESPLQTVTVPNLMVQKFGAPQEGAKFWKSLCKELEEEYRDILSTLADQGQTAGSAIQQGLMFRKSLRTGSRRSYVYDSALDPVSPAISLDGTDVLIAWDPVYDERFSRYEVQRSASLLMTGSEVIRTLSDNHLTTIVDSPGSGTWYYQVTLYNDNNLAAASSVLSVVVP